ncbi:MAG TPA: methyltransferase domain-containing protein, partial [Kofleriaceae bacterium]|nr:methyltransferase domain-containing protein [Kofleriaceae bacterium]
ARLAALYDPETRALVARAAQPPVALAIDLGCGPGWSTRLVHEIARATRTIGIDASERYVSEARARQPDLEFVVGDIARGIPAIGSPDLILARFLLTHLADPHAALGAWADAAAPGARLALHETESLSSSHPALARYYELVGEVQAHHGQALYVGALISRAIAGTGWYVIESRALVLEKPAPAMASLHAANLRTWRTDPFARERFDPDELDALDVSLTAIANGAVAAPPVENVARQLIAARDRSTAR